MKSTFMGEIYLPYIDVFYGARKRTWKLNTYINLLRSFPISWVVQLFYMGVPPCSLSLGFLTYEKNNKDQKKQHIGGGFVEV